MENWKSFSANIVKAYKLEKELTNEILELKDKKKKRESIDPILRDVLLMEDEIKLIDKLIDEKTQKLEKLSSFILSKLEERLDYERKQHEQNTEK